jgi:hypothetical protein
MIFTIDPPASGPLRGTVGQGVLIFFNFLIRRGGVLSAAAANIAHFKRELEHSNLFFLIIHNVPIVFVTNQGARSW